MIFQDPFDRALFNYRSGEPFWLLSLQKNEDGLSMSVVDSITVQQEKEVDFVLMLISLYASSLHSRV